MPDNRNRKRPIQVKFFVDEKELGLIKARMAQLGIENMSAYLRKMAIDGYAAKRICLNSVSRKTPDSLFKMKQRRFDEVNPKEKDDEIIELTDEELDEIFAEDNFDNGEDGSVIRSFYFSNPDPYAKVEPRPDDAPKREFSFDDKGNIVVKNPSAYWLPDIKIVDEHGGTECTVTGSYEGTETLDKKLRRIMEQNAADDKNGITEDADA